MDNAVSRLDNGELKQGVRFVMRRHTRAPLPHAPSSCHLPPATSRQRVAVLAKMRAGVAKQILLLFNCNQIISTRSLRPLYSLSARCHWSPPGGARCDLYRAFKFTNLAPNERVLNIAGPDSLPLFMWFLMQPHPSGCGPRGQRRDLMVKQ